MTILRNDDVRLFVRESNRIEGISRAPSKHELAAHVALLSEESLTLDAVSVFVLTVAGRTLRELPGMDVRVGGHFPPPGGPDIPVALNAILADIRVGKHPYAVHQAYEHLHPYMDGNGRSGRAIWLWQMLHQRRTDAPLTMGFLHLWYYQSLAAAQPETDRRQGR